MAVVLLLYLIAEIAAIWLVASQVGALWTIVLLIAGAIVGSWLARREGGKAMSAVLTAARAGQSGRQEVTDGMLVALGGLLIFLPGFVTDILGVLVMVPPTRTLLRTAWLRRIERTVQTRGQDANRVIVVEGEVAQDRPKRQTDQPRIIDG